MKKSTMALVACGLPRLERPRRHNWTTRRQRCTDVRSWRRSHRLVERQLGVGTLIGAGAAAVGGYLVDEHEKGPID